MAQISTRSGTADELPTEVVAAARLLSEFFARHGVVDWRLGDVAARSLLETTEQRLIEKFQMTMFPASTPPWLRIKRHANSKFSCTSSVFEGEPVFRLKVGDEVTIPIGKPERPALYIRHPDTMEAV